ncbi:MAG: hypothetical protein ABF802_09285 [Acetobacter orientalis]|uniref:hypothetical protein n=1 Tax=Acetobacter orientalis TaxID=146474 RepID=UPI0039EA88CC
MIKSFLSSSDCNLSAKGFVSLDAKTPHWTLTTILSNFIFILEEKYGKRNMNYTPVGIEFCGATPYVWYPGNRNHISIVLSESAAQNLEQAIFQLAHEAVHLLDPSGGSKANVLEEGLATLFQKEICRENDINIDICSEKYEFASQLVTTLLSIDITIIKKLRLKKPLHKIEMDDIYNLNESIDESIIENLCQRFSDWKPSP